MFNALILTVILTFALVGISWSKVDTHFDKHGHHEETNKISGSLNDQKHGGLNTDSHAKTYKHLLKVKHREQLNAVKSIMGIDNKKKQRNLLDELLAKMEKVVRSAKLTIEKADYKPTDSFPEKDEKLRDAVAVVVENTAFFCEFVLRFPSVIEKLLSDNKEWKSLVKWGYQFSSAANLYDDAEQKVLSLAAQQLNLIPRDDKFRNPYDKKVIKEEIEREAVREMKEKIEKKRIEKQKEKNKRKEHKPSLSKNEL